MKTLAKKGNMNERIDVVLRRFRSRMSSYPPGMCPLVQYRSLLQISMHQSCGKCVPCRDGLVEVDRMLGQILSGDGTMETLDEIRSLCHMIMDTADCAVGVVAAGIVLDSIAEFEDEYISHINDRRCVTNVSQTVPCTTLCPAHVNVPGSIDATAHVGNKVHPGETWMPFHFPDAPVNKITHAVFDEFARIPEYKVCAVALERFR